MLTVIIWLLQTCTVTIVIRVLKHWKRDEQEADNSTLQQTSDLTDAFPECENTALSVFAFKFPTTACFLSPSFHYAPFMCS